MENTDKENKYFRAKEKVAHVKKFYTGLTTYLMFMAILAGINYYTDQWRHPWFLWAAFGWGIGLVFQAIKVFGLNLFFGKNWEEKKIKEFMREENGNKQWE